MGQVWETTDTKLNRQSGGFEAGLRGDVAGSGGNGCLAHVMPPRLA